MAAWKRLDIIEKDCIAYFVPCISYRNSCNALEQFLDIVADFFYWRPNGFSFGKEDERSRLYHLAEKRSEALAAEALNAIAVDRPWRHLFRNYACRPRATQGREWGYGERKVFSMNTARRPRNSEEVGTREPVFFWHAWGAGYTVSFARPLRRRRIKTFLPEVLAERARKPCVRTRFRFFGCQFRFVDMSPTILIFPTNTTQKTGSASPRTPQ